MVVKKIIIEKFNNFIDVRIMKSLEEITKIIDEEIAKINWTSEPHGLYEPIAYVLSNGGKRIRPMLVLMGCEMFSENIKEAIPQNRLLVAVVIAKQLECFQNTFVSIQSDCGTFDLRHL